MNARVVCGRCRRPATVCWCDHLPHLPTRTRIVILQHPREREVGIGTARMAHLALPESTLRVGLRFDDLPLEGAALLFPGGADAGDVPPPKTLIVVDGTWPQARSLVKKNPALQTLPRIGFRPRRPSQYRIRREPAEFCVSTIEALAEVLHVLEGGDFDALLEPFRVMVDKQLWYRDVVRASRHQVKKQKQRRPALEERLRAVWTRLVCLQGEANAWPMHDPARQHPEVVHFVALRPATGERYEAVIAPRRPLAPLTPFHIGVSDERLRTGVSVAEWRQSWNTFARPNDVIVQWGRFYSRLAAEDGVVLPQARVDLRGDLSQLRGRGGTLEECVTRLDAALEPPAFDGRAGRRLAALTAVVKALVG
jgi:DTW domain-containing protein YfiP